VGQGDSDGQHQAGVKLELLCGIRFRPFRELAARRALNFPPKSPWQRRLAHGPAGQIWTRIGRSAGRGRSCKRALAPLLSEVMRSLRRQAAT
jgi:hypothetical protein